MFSIPQMTTAKDIQKNYRQIFDKVKKTGKPIVVMRNNEPDVVIMDPKQLDEMQAVMDILASREEARAGKTKELKGSLRDLWYEAQKA